jgi:hypothetical protein
MAPAANLPEVDMTLVQEADIQQSYWLLFQKMKDDFVHKKDLQLILSSATVNGGAQGNSSGPVTVAGALIAASITDSVAQAVAQVYSKAAKTGGTVREKSIEGLEALTS